MNDAARRVLGNVLIQRAPRASSRYAPPIDVEPLLEGWESLAANTVLSMCTWPKRIHSAVDRLAEWLSGDVRPGVACLYLSHLEYPTMASISLDIRERLEALDVVVRFEDGDTRAYRRLRASVDYPGRLVLTVDDDIVPPPRAFESFLSARQHNPGCFVSWAGPFAIGNGTLFDPSVIDQRWLSDMEWAVDNAVDDLWTTMWLFYSGVHCVHWIAAKHDIDSVQYTDRTVTFGNPTLVRMKIKAMCDKYPAIISKARLFAHEHRYSMV